MLTRLNPLEHLREHGAAKCDSRTLYILRDLLDKSARECAKWSADLEALCATQPEDAETARVAQMAKQEGEAFAAGAAEVRGELERRCPMQTETHPMGHDGWARAMGRLQRKDQAE